MKTCLTQLPAPLQHRPPVLRRWWALLVGLVLACALPLASRAQLVSSYAFAASAGTFTPLSSGTPVPVLLADEGVTPPLALGFTFRFDGVDYTSVSATSNGVLSFNANPGGDYDNDLNAIHENDPFIGGLWDDLSGTDPAAAATYSVTGAPGSRVFTFEWLQWKWGYSATAAGVSFQVKLHEGTNQVECVYRPEAGALSAASASVGLRSVGGTGLGSFLSVSTLTTAAVSSGSVSTNGLATKPTAGLTFTFTPTACSVPPVYATLPVSQSFETTWTDACAVRNAAGASWRTTPLVGDNSWRRNDDGAAAAWRSPAGYLPTPVASQGSKAAIFHSAYTVSGLTGNLDLYVDLSGSGTKILTFDYVNQDPSVTAEQLDILLSTDGGQTFGSSLLTLQTSPAYSTHSIAIPSTSATSVIRFRGTGDYGSFDMGLDNVQLVTTTCAPPTGAAVANITSTSANVTFTNSASATNYTVTYQAQSGPVQTVSPSPTGTPVALSGLTPSTTYSVSIVSNCSGGNTSAATATLTFVTAPVNDLCTAPTGLTPAAACTTTNGTMVGASATAGLDSHLDVWYSFVASGPELHITLAGTASTNLVTEVYSVACPSSSTTPVAHNSSSHDTFLTDLTPNQTYRVRVYDFYDATFTPTTGVFTICVTQPPLPTPGNDLCTNPQAITTASPCASTAGTIGGATANTALDTNDDVWYSFVANSTQHNITLGGTAVNNLVTEVYGVACPTNTTTPIIHNASGSNTFVTGLTPGTTYYVRVYNFYTGAGFLTPAAGAFTICIDHPSNAPANDECTTALPLTNPTSTCTSTSGTVFGATQSGVTGGPGTADDDVWYSFVAQNAYAGIYLTNTGGLDLVVNLRGGACGSTTSIRSGDQAAGTAGTLDSISVRNLTPGATYFVRVYSYGTTPATAANGTFTLCVTTPGTCAPPTALTSSNLTNTSAELDWAVGAAGVQYRVEYGPTGFTPGTGTATNTGTNAVLVTGLTAATAYQFYVTQTCASGLSSVRVGPQNFSTTGLNNLVVTNGQTLTNVQGTYDNVTVQTGGSATLAGGLVVNQTIVVQTGGVLNANCQLITGAASFTLNSGGTLGICDAQGIYQTGASGTVQVTGARSFSTDGLYVYNGSAPQSSGPGLPGTVRELTVNNAGNGLTLNNTGLDISRVLRLTNGNFLTNTLAVRLLSSGAGTALVDNTGGTVTGTVQAQRYVNSTLNTGMGYRHFSAPVASPPVSQLSSSGSPIVVNGAFNAASALARPTVFPYPTVFYYNESNVPAGSAAADFDLGFFSPIQQTDPMAPLQGFTTQVSGGQTVTLSGSLNNGAQAKTGLTYTNASPQAGWQLLGNPYPSPLDWSTLTVGTTAANNLQNLNGAVYVFQSSGHYAGTYRSYIGGLGNPLIASGQGFFVRTAGVGQSGTLRLSNANRVTAWSATNSSLYRNAADLRPQIQLGLSSLATGIAPDETTVYFEAGATAATDAAYDAYKLRNPGAAVSLFSLAATDELSINGLPVLTSLAVTVPLGLSVPQAGQYTVTADQLLNFGPTTVYLSDALTGALVNLSQQPGYTFQVAASGLSSKTRFALRFRPGNVTATHSGLEASLVSLFPNPARQEFTVVVPALPAAQTVTAQLVNALGQTVLTRTLPLTSTGLTATFDVRGLATGVYSLRLSAGTEAPLTKRLVIE